MNWAVFPCRVRAQKEPLKAESAAVPSQEYVPLASVSPSKESDGTNEYTTPEETQAVVEPENQRQAAEHQPVA